jgi:hypothetical protein
VRLRLGRVGRLLWLAQLIYVLYRLCPQPCECISNLDLDFIMSTSSSFLDALPRHMHIAESSLTIGKKLGHGSFGFVNEGMFNGQPVCIKVRFVSLVICFSVAHWSLLGFVAVNARVKRPSAVWFDAWLP